jgi:hypothetical protein
LEQQQGEDEPADPGDEEDPPPVGRLLEDLPPTRSSISSLFVSVGLGDRFV